MSTDRGEGPIIVEDEILREGFVQVPILLLRNPDLGAGAKLAYGLLLWYAWRERGYPGHDAAAKEFGISRASLCRYLKELEDAGLLEKKRGGPGQTNSYHLPALSKGVRRLASQIETSSVSNLDALLIQDSSPLESNEYESSFSFFAEIGERFGRSPRDAKALAKSLSKYPEEAVQWGVELLEQRDGQVENPAAWLNAVVPRLVDQLADRERAELTAWQEALLPVRAMLDVYRAVGDSEVEVRRQLLRDFGDPDLVEAALAATGGAETARDGPGGG